MIGRAVALALALPVVMATPVATATPAAAAQAADDRDDWSRVTLDEETAGHERRTRTVLDGGRIATRIEQSWAMPGDPDALTVLHELLVVEDAEGRVLEMDQRHRAGGAWRRVAATVDRSGDDPILVVDAGPAGTHRLPWDPAARGPDALARDLRDKAWGSPVQRFEQVEFVLDAGRPITTVYEHSDHDAPPALARSPEGDSVEYLARSPALGDRPLVLWLDAKVEVFGSSLELPQGTRRAFRCEPDIGRAAAQGLGTVVDRRAGALVLGAAAGGLRIPPPRDYDWFDWWADDAGDAHATACAADGRRLSAELRAAGAAGDLAASAAVEPLVMVERQAADRPALVVKDPAEGRWVLAVDLGDRVLLVRTDGAADAAMEALLELADALTVAG